jgi:hypothetical protein
VAVTVAKAHQVVAVRVVKLNVTCPLLAVVPAPEAVAVPLHVALLKTSNVTLAPLTAASLVALSAATVNGIA